MTGLSLGTERPPLRENRNRGATGRRRIALVLPALLLLGLTPLLMGQAKPAEKVIEAERFVLRDADGTIVAELCRRADGPSLALNDKDGHTRVRLTVAADGASELLFQDRDGRRRAGLQVSAAGEPHLDFASATRSPTNGVTPAVGPTAPKANAASRAAEVLYRPLCMGCHGRDGRGGRAAGTTPVPDFTRAAWQTSRTDAQFLASILNGKGADMPGFDDRLTTAQARDLVAYVRAFAPEAVRSTNPAGDDFDRRMEELRRQWDNLNRQMRELAAPPRKS